MSSKPSGSGVLPDNLPEDFFDSDKKSKREQEDVLTKELEQMEKEMAALDAESQEHIKEEFDKLQEDKNIDELDQQLEQWKRIVELEKRAQELHNKTTSESAPKKLKRDNDGSTTRGGDRIARLASAEDDESDLDGNVEDVEGELFDWRSKKL